MRLTAKHTTQAMISEKNLTKGQMKELKLSQLEDIEDELRINLITLYKAFNHICYKKDNQIKIACHIALVDWAIYILDENMTIGEGISLRLCDYGKTWALTKEELL